MSISPDTFDGAEPPPLSSGPGSKIIAPDRRCDGEPQKLLVTLATVHTHPEVLRQQGQERKRARVGLSYAFVYHVLRKVL